MHRPTSIEHKESLTAGDDLLVGNQFAIAPGTVARLAVRDAEPRRCTANPEPWTVWLAWESLGKPGKASKHTPTAVHQPVTFHQPRLHPAAAPKAQNAPKPAPKTSPFSTSNRPRPSSSLPPSNDPTWLSSTDPCLFLLCLGPFCIHTIAAIAWRHSKCPYPLLTLAHGPLADP